MQDLQERLEVWTSVGLLAPDQAEAIARFEATQPARAGEAARARAPASTPSGSSPLDGQRTRSVLPAEAIGYVGAALAFSAIAWMLGEVWTDLTTGGRLALAGLVTILLLGGGAALARRPSSPLQRLTSVLLLGGTAGAGWCAGIVSSDVLELSGAVLAVSVTATLAVLAVPLYLLRQRALPQLAALGAIVALTISLLLLPDLPPSPWVFGVVLWALGVGWVLASLGGFLPPEETSGVLGGALAVIGTLVAGAGGLGGEGGTGWLVLGVLTATALVGVALWRDTLYHLVVGALGLFVLVPTLAFELFGQTIGAPATLLVVGLLLVALAVGLGRAGREIRSAQRAPEGAAAAVDGGERP